MSLEAEKDRRSRKVGSQLQTFMTRILEEERLSMVPFPDFLENENILSFFT